LMTSSVRRTDVIGAAASALRGGEEEPAVTGVPEAKEARFFCCLLRGIIRELLVMLETAVRGNRPLYRSKTRGESESCLGRAGFLGFR
jgi:hypothetical protein